MKATYASLSVRIFSSAKIGVWSWAFARTRSSERRGMLVFSVRSGESSRST
jgi:hypothetical protein